MFELSWVDELDGAAAADALARSRVKVLQAEAEQLVLAAHWADLHAPELVEGQAPEARVPGAERVVRAGADGCPEIGEFAPAELGVLTGPTTAAGVQRVADAVNLRHRHPVLWDALRHGRVRVWVATTVARRCARARLTLDQAKWVDEQTTPYAATLPPRRFFDLVEARIIEVDPAAAEARATAAALARFVRAGASDEHGLRTLVARAHAGDVTFLVAVLDRIAVLLAARGDTEPLEARRATALRILANPARALALLTEASLEASSPEVDHADLDEAYADQRSGGSLAWMRDSEGRRLPGIPHEDSLPLVDPDEALRRVGFRPAVCGGGASPLDDPQGGGELGSPALLRSLLEALTAGFDARRLDPVTVLHVHIEQPALVVGTGVARVEGAGPVVLGQVRDWLAHPSSPEQVRQQVSLRPVLDVHGVRPVDRYELPARMREALRARDPYESFPFGTLAGRAADADHVEPYDPTGPPGQTGLHNLTPLGRLHHRLKTHGRWRVHRPRPEESWWRTPHGHWLRVDPAGTHHHGRDQELDRAWA